MINISEAYIEYQDHIKNYIINPIPRGGLWYNLFHAGGGDICPLWFLGKKGFAQFLLHTHRTTQNKVTHKKQVFISNKNEITFLEVIVEWCIITWITKKFIFGW